MKEARMNSPGHEVKLNRAKRRWHCRRRLWTMCPREMCSVPLCQLCQYANCANCANCASVPTVPVCQCASVSVCQCANCTSVPTVLECQCANCASVWNTIYPRIFRQSPVSLLWEAIFRCRCRFPSQQSQFKEIKSISRFFKVNQTTEIHFQSFIARKWLPNRPQGPIRVSIKSWSLYRELVTNNETGFSHFTTGALPPDNKTEIFWKFYNLILVFTVHWDSTVMCLEITSPEKYISLACSQGEVLNNATTFHSNCQGRGTRCFCTPRSVPQKEGFAIKHQTNLELAVK